MPGFGFAFFFFLSTAFYLAITVQQKSSLTDVANFRKKMWISILQAICVSTGSNTGTHQCIASTQLVATF